VYVTDKTGSSSDDWIYYQLVYTLLVITLIQAVQCYLSFTPVTVQCYTRTRILSLQLSSPSNGSRRSKCNSLILQILHVSLLTESLFSNHADNSSTTDWELVVNSLLRTLTCTRMNTDSYSYSTAFSLSYKCWSLTCGRTQRCVVLRVTSWRLRDPSLLLRHPVVTA
jgi:hypothetical protein